MPTDPTDIARAEARFHEIAMLSLGANIRASYFPVIDPTAWRGPAYDAYRSMADDIADDLRVLAADMRYAKDLARAEQYSALA